MMLEMKHAIAVVGLVVVYHRHKGVQEEARLGQLKYRVSKKSTGKGKCEYMTWKGFKAALERRRVVDWLDTPWIDGENLSHKDPERQSKEQKRSKLIPSAHKSRGSRRPFLFYVSLLIPLRPSPLHCSWRHLVALTRTKESIHSSIHRIMVTTANAWRHGDHQ